MGKRLYSAFYYDDKENLEITTDIVGSMVSDDSLESLCNKLIKFDKR